MLFPQFYFFLLVCSFQFSFVVLFLLLTLFIVCQAILDCLSSTESLILSIRFCIYSLCSFRSILANSFCAFLVLGHLFLLDSSYSIWRQFSHFSLTANVSQGTLYLVLGFVGIQFAAALRCALTKFSYSSFGVLFFVFCCTVSNLFLNSNTYLSLISLLLRRAQS